MGVKSLGNKYVEIETPKIITSKIKTSKIKTFEVRISEVRVSLEEFIIENQNAFYRLAYSYVKNKDAALDVVNEAVVNALKSCDTLREASFIKTWFYRILVNAAITYIRKDTKYVPTDDMQQFEMGCQDADSTETIDLYNAITLLPEEYKTVITLRFFEDMKISDIALVTGTAESTVKSRVTAALKRLFKTLNKEGEAYGR